MVTRRWLIDPKPLLSTTFHTVWTVYDTCLIGYARVSKADGSQSLDLQRDALRAEGVDAGNVYHDVASGVRDDRPDSTAACAPLRKGDVLVVWKLDRLGAATSPTWSTPCRTCRSAAWACGLLTGQGAQIDITTAAGLPRIWHLRGAGRVRAGADPRTHPGRAHGRGGRADATAVGRSRCRKPRCG